MTWHSVVKPLTNLKPAVSAISETEAVFLAVFQPSETGGFSTETTDPKVREAGVTAQKGKR